MGGLGPRFLGIWGEPHFLGGFYPYGSVRVFDVCQCIFRGIRSWFKSKKHRHYWWGVHPRPAPDSVCSPLVTRQWALRRHWAQRTEGFLASPSVQNKKVIIIFIKCIKSRGKCSKNRPNPLRFENALPSHLQQRRWPSRSVFKFFTIRGFFAPKKSRLSGGFTP